MKVLVFNKTIINDCEWKQVNMFHYDGEVSKGEKRTGNLLSLLSDYKKTVAVENIERNTDEVSKPHVSSSPFEEIKHLDS